MAIFLSVLVLSSITLADSIEGFVLEIHPRVPIGLAENVKKRIRQNLKEISAVAPKLFQSTQGKVKIWLTDSGHQSGAATYHSSAQWLSERGMDPAMASGIEIVDLNNFLLWSSPGDQPMMLLHELMHAYHHQILSWEHGEVRATYEAAKVSGKYNSVPYRGTNEKKPAYAMVDEREYLAEISEAYFGSNDFFPFNRSELESFDPKGFELLKNIFGP
jgi:hypothetical protein